MYRSLVGLHEWIRRDLARREPRAPLPGPLIGTGPLGRTVTGRAAETGHRALGQS